jgi:hypothetical protein
MSPRRTASIALALLTMLAVPAAAHAGPGFKLPGERTTCGILPGAEGMAGGLYCASAHIEEQAYDGMGIVRLKRDGAAKVVPSGNDLLLFTGGYEPDGSRDPRPALRAGERWRRGGYACRNRDGRLTCRRGAHGFALTRDAPRLW